jgi:hypothetical protein
LQKKTENTTPHHTSGRSAAKAGHNRSRGEVFHYSMALMRKPYRMCGKRSMPAEWLDPVPHTHLALDDAIEQGRLSATC